MWKISNDKVSIKQIREELEDACASLDKIGEKPDSKIIDSILSVSIENLNAEEGIVFLKEDFERTTIDSQGDFIAKFAYGLDEKKIVNNLIVPVDLGIIGETVKSNPCIIINDRERLMNDPVFRQLLVVLKEVRSCICIPLRLGEQVIGVLCILNKGDGSNFTGEDEKLIAPIADLLALLIAEINSLLKINKYTDVICGLGSSLKESNSYHFGMNDEIDKYVKDTLLEFIKEKEIPDEEKEMIQIASQLYDIGKKLIPKKILHEKGELTEEDWEVIKRHPGDGYDMLKSIDVIKPLLPLIRWHHERMDGKGYPDKLFSGQLPLLVKILTIADAYYAMTCEKKPYWKKKMSQKETIEELRQNIGTQFDPKVVEKFCIALKKKDDI